MATQIIKTVFQFRRGTTAEWEANKGTIPAAGEPCFDIELNTLKIGNGKKTYEQLDAINGAKFELAADGKSLILNGNTLELIGFKDATPGMYPVKMEDGTLGWALPNNQEIEDLREVVSGLTSDVNTIQNTLTEIKEIVNPSEEGSMSLLERIEGIEKEVSLFLGDDGRDERFDTLIELVDYIDKHGKEAVDMATSIQDLYSLVSDASTAIAGKVDKEEGKGLSSNDFSDDLLTKLESIQEGAQVNAVEKVSVGGTILDIVNKVIDIPVATADRAGVVKSSTGANKVNISNSGEMSVNKVSVNSLFVPIGDELVLDGGGASKGEPVYSTRIGDIGYSSISNAINCADNGDVVTLQEDINMGTKDNDNLVINAENVTIDLGGKTLTANGSNGAIKVEGGVTTLDGTGTVMGTLGSDNYSMAVWAHNGTVVINNGVYKNTTDGTSRGTDLIYVSGTGCVEINGGVFEAAKPEWTLNCKDADYNTGKAKIIVKGGFFKDFDPANNNAEGSGTNFVAEGYKSVLEGGYYVVKPM